MYVCKSKEVLINSQPTKNSTTQDKFFQVSETKFHFAMHCHLYASSFHLTLPRTLAFSCLPWICMHQKHLALQIYASPWNKHTKILPLRKKGTNFSASHSRHPVMLVASRTTEMLCRALAVLLSCSPPQYRALNLRETESVTTFCARKN